jgi:hypothetical protein
MKIWSKMKTLLIGVLAAVLFAGFASVTHATVQGKAAALRNKIKLSKKDEEARKAAAKTAKSGKINWRNEMRSKSK